MPFVSPMTTPSRAISVRTTFALAGARSKNSSAVVFEYLSIRAFAGAGGAPVPGFGSGSGFDEPLPLPSVVLDASERAPSGPIATTSTDVPSIPGRLPTK